MRGQPLFMGKRDNSVFLTHPVNSEYRDVAQYWMLELLVYMGAQKELLRHNFCIDVGILHELGLSYLVETTPFNSEDTRQALFELHQELRNKPVPTAPTHTQLAKNIDWLGKVVGLNETERAILHFRVIASRHLPLRSCLEFMGKSIDLLYAAHLLGHLLSLPETIVEQALQPNSTLTRSGLISVSPKTESLMLKVALLEGCGDNLFASHTNAYAIFRNNFIEVCPPKLSDKDYPHLQEDIAILSGYLNAALEKRQVGVNVLIYGTPGSGKTEFVRMFAQKIGYPLFEVATENSAGMPIRGHARLRAYRLSQHILANNQKSSLILFDEIEDIFRVKEDIEGDQASNLIGMKGWVNKLLEENPVPSFWLSNSLLGLDRAFIRRFDYVIELNAPPRSVRNKILDQYLDKLAISQNWKAAMAEHEHLNPALVERSARVIELAIQRNPSLQAEKSLERILGNSLEALGLHRSSKNVAQCSTEYRLDALNTDCDAREICDGLSQHSAGRICLYGPPGTGKTLFARYLANTLDLPLMVRRASDLLSMWLGETEKNLARMFREATEENAVLLLDEADSFLRDRSGASQRWEATQVNEMLTQMEGFQGIFIATTNMFDALDAAALRRFDLKVKFGFLRPDQAWQLFVDIAKKLNFDTSAIHQTMLRKLHLLTPGDFANVILQSRLRNISSSSDLLILLKAECAAKPEGSQRAIGF